MLNAISGAMMLDGGQIVINGDNVTAMPVHMRATRIARVFQDPDGAAIAASMTIAENMLLAELRARRAGHQARAERGEDCHLSRTAGGAGTGV